MPVLDLNHPETRSLESTRVNMNFQTCVQPEKLGALNNPIAG